MTTEWITDLSPKDWDHLLATHNGHPLQSAAWGHSRHEVDGHSSLYLLNQSKNQPNFLARVETRNVKGIGKVAWIPKGPVYFSEEQDQNISQLISYLKQEKFKICVTNDYKKVSPSQNTFQTIWVDLQKNESELFSALHSQFRSRVRKSEKESVEIRELNDEKYINHFFKLCEELSETKSFELPGSNSLINNLINSQFSENLKFSFYGAIYQEKLIGGLVIAKSGQHLHFLWGASDRDYTKQRPSEALHWHIIKYGANNNYIRYDLEGIDIVNNPGVYRFKNRMGGQIIHLQAHDYHALSPIGNLGIKIGKFLKKI